MRKLIERIKKSYKRSQSMLLWIEITDVEEFKNGEKDTCMAHMHPIIKEFPDDIRCRVLDNMGEIIDLVREHGDMKIL